MDDFEQWVRARARPLSRSAYLLTGDLQLAEDLVQDTLARVAQHWRRLHRSGDPDAYARVVMHHLTVDRWRRRRVRPQEVLAASHPELGRTSGGDLAVDQRLLLRDALLRLTPKQRAVLSLRFLEDLTEARTATVLGCSVSTVKSQTRVALQRIREVAPDLLGELTDPAPTYGTPTEAKR